MKTVSPMFVSVIMAFNRKYASVWLACLVIIAALSLGSQGGAMKRGHTDEYYLSPNGSDDNPGTLALPWKTLEYAISQLSLGDVLNLRGGVYYEHDLVVNLNGAASDPIIIQSFPGEKAIIDGGMPDFQNAPNNQWELVDDSIHLYRSKQPVSYSDRLGGWLLDYDVQLMKYVDYDIFTSTNYDAPDNYLGPGVYGRDGHIYIRLQQNPRHLKDRFGNPLLPIPPDPDPNKLSINIFSSDTILIFEDASYVKVRNLDIGPAYYTIAIKSPSHHIEIDGCRITHKNASVLSRSGTSDIEVHHSEVNMGFPPWIYWGDVKGTPRPAYYSGWNSFAILGVWRNSHIHHNIIWNSFDGIAVSQGSVNSQVTDNTIIRSRDDAIDLEPNVADIEVAFNTIRHCFEGVSINTSDDSVPLGDVYVHHNIIDVSAYHRAARPGTCSDFCGDEWHPGITFGNHDCADGNCYLSDWKIYNNTIIARDTSRLTTAYDHHIMYNNIVFVIGAGSLSSLPQSAGNVFWRTEGGLSGFSEPEGLEVDPGFDVEAIEELNYALTSIRNIYRPTNPQIFSPGVSYSNLDWPGTQDVKYRGAIPPYAPIFFPRVFR